VRIRLRVERLEDRWCPASYAITDLGTFGGVHSNAMALNNANPVQVVGEAQLGSPGDYHAFLYTSGVLTDLGALAGDANSFASAINDSGLMVGSSYGSTSASYRAVWWQSGSTTPTDLGNLGSSPTLAEAINNAGQVVGYGNISTTPNVYVYHAWLWQNGILTDLNNLLPPNSGWVLSHALGLNENGQIVGDGVTPSGQMHAFLWKPGSGLPTDLGMLAGDSTSNAYAVNKAGQVVGVSTPASGYDYRHAFSWTGGSMTGLGALPTDNASYAAGINNAKSVQVVGASIHGTGLNTSYRAVLWQSGKAINLIKQIPSNSGWSDLLFARGINDNGLIVGTGVLNNGGEDAYLLTPATGGKPPRAGAHPARAVTATEFVTPATPLLGEASHRWYAARVNASGPGTMQIQITDFGGRRLGLAEETPDAPGLDYNAAGWGWFVARRSWGDFEFPTAGNPGEQPGRDLLLVLVQEIGAA
jgi:probable HAF family extracellular repeat protein